jgi:hypothetical protein
MAGMIETLFDRVLPRPSGQGPDRVRLESLLEEHGFDRGQHERVRADLRRGQIGLAQNRLQASTVIENVRTGDVLEEGAARNPAMVRLGREALRGGRSRCSPSRAGRAAAGRRAPGRSRRCIRSASWGAATVPSWRYI